MNYASFSFGKEIEMGFHYRDSPSDNRQIRFICKNLWNLFLFWNFNGQGVIYLLNGMYLSRKLLSQLLLKPLRISVFVERHDCSNKGSSAYLDQSLWLHNIYHISIMCVSVGLKHKIKMHVCSKWVKIILDSSKSIKNATPVNSNIKVPCNLPDLS